LIIGGGKMSRNLYDFMSKRALVRSV